jgi:hypothetical protein
MITRAGRKNNYADVTVCDRWRDSFENFLADIGPRPSPKHSIDRLDPWGHYHAANCAWRTAEFQNNNLRSSPLYTVALDGIDYAGNLANIAWHFYRLTDDQRWTPTRLRRLMQRFSLDQIAELGYIDAVNPPQYAGLTLAQELIQEAA